MASSSVVELEPGRKGVGAFGVGGEDLAVGPLGGQGSVQSFDLPVLPGAVGLDEHLAGAEVGAGLGASGAFSLGSEDAGFSEAASEAICAAPERSSPSSPMMPIVEPTGMFFAPSFA